MVISSSILRSSRLQSNDGHGSLHLWMDVWPAGKTLSSLVNTRHTWEPLSIAVRIRRFGQYSFHIPLRTGGWAVLCASSSSATVHQVASEPVPGRRTGDCGTHGGSTAQAGRRVAHRRAVGADWRCPRCPKSQPLNSHSCTQTPCKTCPFNGLFIEDSPRKLAPEMIYRVESFMSQSTQHTSFWRLGDCVVTSSLDWHGIIQPKRATVWFLWSTDIYDWP